MELLIILILYVGLAALINEMAKTRNRNQAAWVVLSILFSPLLGILFLLLIGKAKETQ